MTWRRGTYASSQSDFIKHHIVTRKSRNFIHFPRYICIRFGKSWRITRGSLGNYIRCNKRDQFVNCNEIKVLLIRIPFIKMLLKCLSTGFPDICVNWRKISILSCPVTVRITGWVEFIKRSRSPVRISVTFTRGISRVTRNRWEVWLLNYGSTANFTSLRL